MLKYSFRNDYSEGTHPNILNALISTNLMQEEGYGEDSFCNKAIKLIRKAIKNPNADIHFVSGGTQSNLVSISSMLRPYESVIAANTAHISVHETGAIEATGHKINTIEAIDGKLDVKSIQEVLEFHEDEHMVKPKLVFISNTTEIGSIYKKNEIEKISKFCRENNLFLYLDGARLGSALTATENDLTLPDLAKLVDIFYIGGTKNGALLGEALIINNDSLKENFRFYLKQRGALLAKGRLFGIQFLELFKNDLFFEMGKHANQMAVKLAEGIEKAGYDFLTKPVSNQIFPILPSVLIDKLSQKYEFYIWKKLNSQKAVIRLVTSWATKEEFIDRFIKDLIE